MSGEEEKLVSLDIEVNSEEDRITATYQWSSLETQGRDSIDDEGCGLWSDEDVLDAVFSAIGVDGPIARSQARRFVTVIERV